MVIVTTYEKCKFFYTRKEIVITLISIESQCEFIINLLIYNRVVDKMKVVYPFYESVIIKKPKKVNV